MPKGGPEKVGYMIGIISMLILAGLALGLVTAVAVLTYRWLLR